MRKMFLSAVIFTALVVGGLFGGTESALAAIGYKGGVYVNLCGTGTAATAYRCEANCNPFLGTCTGTNDGVVRYVCSGRWDQCLESESFWGNSAEIGTQACGRTVQLSVYDKKCRKDDGSWDASCRLQGYMVWYSGDCWSGVGPTPTPYPVTTSPVIPTPTTRVTVAPSPTVTPRSTVAPSPTVKPTGSAVCGKSCVMQSDCGAGFTCYQGVCRNPSCRTDSSCFCGPVPTTTATGSGTQSPDTGGEVLLFLFVPMLIAGGILARKYAGRVW